MKSIPNIPLYTALACLVLLFSCGPRSGIHNDTDYSSGEQKDYTPAICGNGVRSAIDAAWAESKLGFSGDEQKGALLYKQFCAVCHDIGNRQFTGPGLGNVYWRVPAPQGDWLRNYILSSSAMYKSADPYSKKLRAEYPKDRMPDFKEELTEQQLNNILIYVVGNSH